MKELAIGTTQEQMLREVMARDCEALQREKYRQEYATGGDPGETTKPSKVSRAQIAAVARQRRKRDQRLAQGGEHDEQVA